MTFEARRRISAPVLLAFFSATVIAANGACGDDGPSNAADSRPDAAVVNDAAIESVDAGGADARSDGDAALTRTTVLLHAAGVFTCALVGSGPIKCWGANALGQLGNGSDQPSAAPVPVTGTSLGVALFSLGEAQGCFVSAAGGAKCWGDGPLGNNALDPSPVPVDVFQLSSGVAFVQAAAGYGHTCAVTTSGTVKCWGNVDTVENDASSSVGLVPHDVPGLSSATALALGKDFTCGLLPPGKVRCVGDNTYGTLGDGSPDVHSSNPVEIQGSLNVTAIHAGRLHACALTSAGGVKCWGDNRLQQLGGSNPVQSGVPVDVVGLASGVVALGGGAYHTCAILTTGDAKCWGRNLNGALGSGDASPTPVPVAVNGFVGKLVAISGGDAHTCGLSDLGTIQCWGNNAFGQLGAPSAAVPSSFAPITVAGL